MATDGPRILTIDIETSPNLAHVWRIFQENVGISQILEASEVLCFAAKWYDEKQVMFYSQPEHTQETMIKTAYDLIDEADVVVHYNGKRFDVPHLSREFLLAGMTPPSPIRQIDLLQIVRQRFKFTSNKLDYVAQQLGLGKKTSHTGHELWLGCINGDPNAWRLMEKYNKQDVRLTEKVFDRLKPWLGNQMNVGLYTGSEFACPTCGSANVQKRGTKVRAKSTVQQYACMDCGAWSTDGVSLTKTTLSGII